MLNIYHRDATPRSRPCLSEKDVAGKQANKLRARRPSRGTAMIMIQIIVIRMIVIHTVIIHNNKLIYIYIYTHTCVYNLPPNKNPPLITPPSV